MFPKDLNRLQAWYNSGINCPPYFRTCWELVPKDKLDNRGIPVPYDEYPDRCPLCNCRCRKMLVLVDCCNPRCPNWDGKTYEVEYE